MADPTIYEPGYDFAATDKGANLNVELQRVAASVRSIASALADIRRSDGKLKNSIVTPDALNATALAGASELGAGLEAELADAVARVGAQSVAATNSASAAQAASAGAVLAAEQATGAAVSAMEQAAATKPYATRVEAVAATVSATVGRIGVIAPNGRTVLGYIRAASTAGAALTTNGGSVGWVPDGVSTVLHYGATGNGVTDDLTAIQSALNANTGRTLVFPTGIYQVSAPAEIKTNTRLVGENGAIIRAATQTRTTGSLLMFATGTSTDIVLDGLTFDGNKGNVGTATLPVLTFYQTKRLRVRNCTFQNTQGIALNISRLNEDIEIEGCRFIDVGRNPDGSEGTRSQGIAFSNTTSGEVTRSHRVRISNNTFLRVGLDCISFSNISGADIVGNVATDCYTFFYGGGEGYCEAVTLAGNAIRTVNQGALVNGVPPVAIDIPNGVNYTVVGNSIDGVAAAAIGVFVGSRNVVIANNTIRNAGNHSQYQDVPWQGAICVGGKGAAASNISDVSILGNEISDELGLMRWGLVLRADLVNCYVAGNNIQTGTQGRYGRYSGAATPLNATITALTDSSGVSATTIIEDVDFTNARVNHWRRLNSLSGYQVGGLDVIGARKTGWVAPTGTATRTTFETSTATTAQLAERLKALLDDLTAHGIIGA